MKAPEWSNDAVRLEAVADVLKRPYARVRMSEVRYLDIGEVRKLMDDLRDVIGGERTDYFLGSIFVERESNNRLRLYDGRKRLFVVALLLDGVRLRLSGTKPKRRRGHARVAMQSIDAFLDGLVEPLSSSARARLLRRWLTFVERHVMVATVFVPSEALMRIFAPLSTPREVGGVRAHAHR